jgi:hypothetical protein
MIPMIMVKKEDIPIVVMMIKDSEVVIQGLVLLLISLPLLNKMEQLLLQHHLQQQVRLVHLLHKHHQKYPDVEEKMIICWRDFQTDHLQAELHVDRVYHYLLIISLSLFLLTV